MPDEPLSSPQAYEAYIYGLSERYPSIQRSTLSYIPSGALFGRVEGMVFFITSTFPRISSITASWRLT